jgi:hypothetical protein
VWQKLHRHTWEALSHTFEHLAQSLERHKRFIEAHGLSLRHREANLDQCDELMCVGSGLDSTRDPGGTRMEIFRYRNDMNGRRDKFEEAEIIRKEAGKRRVMSWISASKKTQSLHKQFQDMRICSDAGRWLFRRYSEVTDWIKEDQPPSLPFGSTAVWDFVKTSISARHSQAEPVQARVC